jgi:hypothetical protein
LQPRQSTTTPSPLSNASGSGKTTAVCPAGPRRSAILNP